MCRKNQLRGFSAFMFGLGLIVGHCLESWMLSCCGGMVVILLGLYIARSR